MIILKQILKLIQLLHSENGSKSIAIGIALGFVMGFTPILSLQGFLIVLILLLFRVQIAAALLSWLAFSFLPLMMSKSLNSIGLYVLQHEILNPFWTKLYQAPIFPLTQFNNSIIMGGFIAGVIGAPLVYLIFLYLVKKYRNTIGSKLDQTKFIKFIKASKLYNWYTAYAKNFS